MVKINNTIKEIATEVQIEIKNELGIDLTINEIIEMFDMQFTLGIVKGFQQCEDIKLDYVGKFQIKDTDREKFKEEIKKIKETFDKTKN